MGRRTVLLVAALLIAAVGTGLVFAYVSRVDDRAIADQQPTEVLVVKKAVTQGTSVSDAEKAGSFEIKKVAASSVASGALSDLAPIREQFALAPLFVGEQVLQAKFGSANQSSGLVIPKGQLAISVQLTDPARVAGFVEPGSEVAIFAAGTFTVAGKPTLDAAITLLPRVKVLAVGPTTVAQANDTSGTTNKEPLPRTILTLALNQNDAQKIILADSKGDLYFGLLNADSRTGKSAPTTPLSLIS